MAKTKAFTFPSIGKMFKQSRIQATVNIYAICPTLELKNFPKPIERETRKLSLFSIDLQVRIRPTARHDNSTLSAVQYYHRSIKRRNQQSQPINIKILPRCNPQNSIPKSIFPRGPNLSRSHQTKKQT